MSLKRLRDRERFNGKYVVDVLSGCWCWAGRLDKDGYAAQMRIGSRTDGSRKGVRPHRWIFEQERGDIAQGLVIDHLCRNRSCVNPAHMEAVPPLINHERGLRAKRTVCPKGHAIEGWNEVKRDGGVRCRICANEYQREYARATGHRYSKAYRQRRKGEVSSATVTGS